MVHRHFDTSEGNIANARRPDGVVIFFGLTYLYLGEGFFAEYG